MRCLVFDSGPIITLTMNNLLWILEPLKSRFNGQFYITPEIKNEVIDRPFNSKNFKFNSLQVLQYVGKDVIKIVINDAIKSKAEHLLNLANHCFMASGHYISIVHYGEMEALAAAVLLKADALVVDERLTRYLVEKPERASERLSNKLHIEVQVDKENIERLKEELRGLKIIRSIELVTVAYESGLLDLFITEKEERMIPDIRKSILESVLWGVKLKGCSVSEEEINDIIKLETLSP